MIVRRVASEDLEQLQEIGRKTFKETFSVSNSEENMAHYLENGFSSAKLAAELKNPDSQFYFVQQNNRIIGYLKLNTGKAQTELKNEYALEIERIYVLQEFHGQHVGKLLYDKAIEIAHHQNAPYVWLGVWEENPRAISFYTKNGFVPFDKHLFKLGDDEQTDILMKKELASFI